MKLTVYRRSEAVVCYEGYFFPDASTLENFIRKAIASGLKWFWASTRTKPLPEDSSYAHLPEARPLTPLEETSAPLFVADYSERNIDGDLRFIFLLAVSADAAPILFGHDSLSAALESFATQAASPIHLVLVQLGDSADLLFVPSSLDLEGTEASRVFGITKAQVTKTRKYDLLRLAKLETLNPHLVSVAFSQRSSGK